MENSTISEKTTQARMRVFGIGCLLFSLVPAVPQAYFNPLKLAGVFDIVLLFVGISVLVYIRRTQQKKGEDS